MTIVIIRDLAIGLILADLLALAAAGAQCLGAVAPQPLAAILYGTAGLGYVASVGLLAFVAVGTAREFTAVGGDDARS